MKLKAKILPHYFEQIKEGKKEYDYRQMESITFVNTETLEEITFEVTDIQCVPSWNYETVVRQFPDVLFNKGLDIFRIYFGKRINAKEE